MVSDTMKRTLLALIVLLAGGLFLGGCTLAKDDSADENQKDTDSSKVTVISGKEDDSNDSVSDSSGTLPDNTVTPSEDGDTPTSSDDTADADTDTGSDTDSDADTGSDPDSGIEPGIQPEITELNGTKSIDGASADEGASVNGYEYEVVDGALVFKWVVKGSEEMPYPSVEAGFDADSNLVVEFPDIIKDYVAEEPEEMEMGGQLLPKLAWESGDGNSMYTFKFGKEMTFTLETEQDGDRSYLILSVEL